MQPFIIDDSGVISFTEGIKALDSHRRLRSDKYNKMPGDSDGKDKKRYYREVDYMFHMYSWYSSFAKVVNEAERRKMVLEHLKIDDMKLSPEMEDLIANVKRMQESDTYWTGLQRQRGVYERWCDICSTSEDPKVLQEFLMKQDAILEAMKKSEEKFYTQLTKSNAIGGREVSEWES